MNRSASSGGERGSHECSRGRGKRIRCGVEEDVEIVACGWWGEGKLGLRLDMLEPRATGHGHEVAIIEAAEEVLVRRASRSVSVVELSLQVRHLGHVIAPEVAGAVGAHPAVERLAERQPASRAQHAVILGERSRAIRDEKEHGALDHHVNRCRGDRREIGRLRTYESRALCARDLRHGVAAVFEERLRDVREDDVAIRRASLQSAETEQTLAGADVEDRVPGTDLGAIEDLIPHRGQAAEILGAHPGTAPVAAGAQPGCPDVGIRHGSTRRARSCPPRHPLP